MRSRHEGTTTDVTTRNQLVMEHVALVKTLAGRMAHRLPSQVETSELVSVGVLGLIDAAGRFNAELGVPFDAFARRRIQGAMLDMLRSLDWASRAARRQRRDVDGAVARLRAELGREPEVGEIARALGLSEADFDRQLDQLRQVEAASVRQPATDQDGTSLLDLAVDLSEGPHQRLERKEQRALLAKSLRQLPAREQRILTLYYQQDMTLAEIGRVIGVGESRVSQLRTQAISRLRALLAPARTRPTTH